MANRFGRNQKRKLTELMTQAKRESEKAKRESEKAQRKERDAENMLATVMREQLSKGMIPLEVEHFLSRKRYNSVMHVIFDERRANLHYQHELSPNDMRIARDRAERERFGQYLGRAIADKIAEAYAGRYDRPAP